MHGHPPRPCPTLQWSWGWEGLSPAPLWGRRGSPPFEVAALAGASYPGLNRAVQGVLLAPEGPVRVTLWGSKALSPRAVGNEACGPSGCGQPCRDSEESQPEDQVSIQRGLGDAADKWTCGPDRTVAKPVSQLDFPDAEPAKPLYCSNQLNYVFFWECLHRCNGLLKFPRSICKTFPNKCHNLPSPLNSVL